MFSKYGKCTCLLKIKNNLKSGGTLDILWKLLIKQLFHSLLLDMRWLSPARRYVPRWPSIISYPTRTRGIIVNYFSDVIPLYIRLYTPEAFAISIKCHMIMIILHHRRNSLFSWGEGKGGGNYFPFQPQRRGVWWTDIIWVRIIVPTLIL